MTYVIVTEKKTVIGKPFMSFAAALNAAIHIFGDDVTEWMNLNLRVEENR